MNKAALDHAKHALDYCTKKDIPNCFTELVKSLSVINTEAECLLDWKFKYALVLESDKHISHISHNIGGIIEMLEKKKEQVAENIINDTISFITEASQQYDNNMRTNKALKHAKTALLKCSSQDQSNCISQLIQCNNALSGEHIYIKTRSRLNPRITSDEDTLRILNGIQEIITHLKALEKEKALDIVADLPDWIVSASKAYDNDLHRLMKEMTEEMNGPKSWYTKVAVYEPIKLTEEKKADWEVWELTPKCKK